MANQPVAFAATTQPSSLQKINVEERNAVGLEEFKNYISKFFNNPEEYTLYDKSGNDISDEFYEKYNNLFEKGDFSVLQEISESTISYMSYHPLPGSIDNISSTISRANKRYTYDLYTVGILIEGVMDFEVQMTPRLTYYVDSSGKIVQPVNDPVLDIAIHDFVVYDFSFKNIEVWSYVSADGKTVYFGGEFCVYRALEGTAFYSGKMKVEAVLGLALITGTSISPAYASEIEPRYSIETIEVELEVPATIPSQQLTDSTGRTVSFPKFRSSCIVTCAVDIDTRTGSIVRASVKDSSLDLGLAEPPSSDLEHNSAMNILYIQVINPSDCITIASDKKSFRINAEMEAKVHYEIIWMNTTPPVPSLYEDLYFNISGSATYRTA